ncbi:MAG TPA: Ig-like domain-containing protein, partial [Longimicrobiales bacterium]|nr:Ig-like domain-containing protein [Longimicrobiales bacterium]
MPARICRSAALLTLGLLPACGGDGTSPDESPASIRLVPTLDTLTWIGQTLTIQGTALSASGLDLGLPLTWASSDTTVATVSATGTVTAVSSGATAVTASVGTVSATAVIVVRQEAVELTAISGDAQTAEAGQTLPLNPVVRADDQGGTPVEGALVTWIPAPGSGTASPGASATDAGGLANTTWTLGEL